VALHRSKPKFYGKRVREVRGKYFLGESSERRRNLER